MLDTIILDQTYLVKNYKFEDFINTSLSKLEDFLSDKITLPNLKSNYLAIIKEVSLSNEYYSNKNLFSSKLATVYKEQEVTKLNYFINEFFQSKFDDITSDWILNSYAKNVIETISQKSYQIALQIKPIYSEIFITQLLNKVKLTANNFNLITTNDIFHYDDVNIRFFQELLEKLNKDSQHKTKFADECLFVSRNKEKLTKAAKLGFLTYYITDNKEKAPFTYQGTFEDFNDFVNNLSKTFVTMDA